MAYYGGGYNASSGSVFGGFAGGYNQTPQGIIFPSEVNSLGEVYPSMPGANLSSVNPNNYPGVVHYGPSTAIIGPQLVEVPLNAGLIDPNLGLVGAANLNAGF